MDIQIPPVFYGTMSPLRPQPKKALFQKVWWPNVSCVLTLSPPPPPITSPYHVRLLSAWSLTSSLSVSIGGGEIASHVKREAFHLVVVVVVTVVEAAVVEVVAVLNGNGRSI